LVVEAEAQTLLVLVQVEQVATEIYLMVLLVQQVQV
jgi:hypothetical protein